MDIEQLIASRTTDGPDTDVITCDIATPVREVVSLLATKRIGAIPVLRDGAVAGICSERDIVYRLAENADEGRGAFLDGPVEAIMTAPAITVTMQTSTLEALALMSRRRIRHLPVLDNGALAGFISIGDIVKARIDEVQHEAEALRDYIQTA